MNVIADIPFDAEGFEKAMTLIKSLNNPSRLMILCLLGYRDMNVSELSEAVGLSMSALSQHLAVLKSADFVETEKVAQTVTYRIKNDDVHQVIDLLKTLYCKV